MIAELAQIELLTWLKGGAIVLFIVLIGSIYHAVVDAPFIEGEEDDFRN